MDYQYKKFNFREIYIQLGCIFLLVSIAFYSLILDLCHKKLDTEFLSPLLQ